MSQNRNLSILADSVNSSGILTPAGGGTGLATTPANGQIDIGNGTGFTRATLTAGTNISITNAAGSVTINSLPPSAGNGPAFSVYSSVTPSVSSGVYTKIVLDTKIFDTNSNFDNTTNYRFTPTVAGYYQINGNIFGSASGAVYGVGIAIYKNGGIVATGSITNTTGSQTSQNSHVSFLVYMNGSTDYLELYGYVTGSGTCSIGSGQAYTYMNGFLARIA